MHTVFSDLVIAWKEFLPLLPGLQVTGTKTGRIFTTTLIFVSITIKFMITISRKRRCNNRQAANCSLPLNTTRITGHTDMSNTSKAGSRMFLQPERFRRQQKP